jgi:outer membrane protein TolC
VDGGDRGTSWRHQGQYTAGLTDFQAVLVSERATAGLEDDLAVSDAAVTSSLISLYKALGGGFEGTDAGVLVAAARVER